MRAGLLVLAAFALVGGCKPPVKGCKPRPPKPPPGLIEQTAKRADDRLDSALESVSGEDVERARNAICSGISLYYDEDDWASALAEFGQGSAALRNAAIDIQKILAEQLGARERFLKVSCLL